MRNYVLHWQRGAMSFVLAAACASSLTTSGCNRSSSREVGIDLSKQAAESALQAERSIAVRQRELDQSHKDSPSEEIAGKVFLPGTKPRVSKNPLAQLLADRSENLPSGDPFLESSLHVPLDHRSNEKFAPQVQTQTHEPTANVSLAQHVDGVQPIASTSVSSRGGSPVAKPFPAIAISPSNATSQSTTDFRFVEKRVNRENVAQIKKSDKTRDSERFSSSPERSNQQSSSRSITSTNNSKFEFSSNDLGRWKNLGNNLAPKDSFQAFKPKKTQQVDTATSSQANQHYKRMATLLAKAKIQQSRGELHSAYRSALLAKSIVDQHKFAIAKNEVDPSLFASEIAAKIWGTRSPENAQHIKVPPQSDLPAISPKRTRLLQHDQAFTTPNHYLDWQDFSKKNGQNVQENRLSKEPSPVAHMKVAREPATINATKSHQSRPAPKVQQLTRTSAAEPSGFSKSNSQPVNPVFAQIVNSPDKEKAPQRARPMPNRPNVAQAPSVVSNFGELRALPLSQEDASPIPDEPDFLMAQSLPVVPQLELPTPNRDRDEVVIEREISSQTNAKWGLIAFILAVISTLVGLKFGGNPSGKSIASQENDTKDASDDDRPRLKISKAA